MVGLVRSEPELISGSLSSSASAFGLYALLAGKLTRRHTSRRLSRMLRGAVPGGLRVVTLVRPSRSQGEFLPGLREGDL